MATTSDQEEQPFYNPQALPQQVTEYKPPKEPLKKTRFNYVLPTRELREQLPEGQKFFWNYQILKGLPEQQNYQLLGEEWSNATFKNMQYPNQSYFAEDPKRLAKYYYFGATAPQDWQPPEWYDYDKIAEAYEYMTAVQGSDWASWKPFDRDDPSAIYLTTLSEPPNDFKFPGEINESDELLKLVSSLPLDENGLVDISSLQPTEHDKLMQLMYGGEQKEISPFMQEGAWENMETWQQWALSFLNPQPMEGRPDWTRGVAATVQGAQAAMGALAVSKALIAIGSTAGVAVGGPAGAIVGGVAGAVVGGAAAYQAYTGTEIWGLNTVLRVLDLPDEMFEKLVGTVVQASDGETKEVLQNLKPAWQAGQFMYESLPVGNWLLNGMSKGFQAAEKVVNSLGGDVEWSSGQVARNNAEIWALEKAIVEPVLIREGLVAGAALDQARSRLASGEDMHEVYADYIDRFGYSGNIGDFMLQSVLDPLQVAPSLVNASLGKIADATNNPNFRAAVDGTKGHLDADILPAPFQRMYTKITGRSGSAGLFDTLGLYKDYLRHGNLPYKYWLDQTVDNPTLKMARPDLFLTADTEIKTIINNNATANADTGVLSYNTDGFTNDFRAYVESQLTNANIDLTNQEIQTIITEASNDAYDVLLDVAQNNPGKTDAEFNRNLTQAFDDYLDERILGQIRTGVDGQVVKVYPEISDWERKFAKLTDDGQYAELQPNQSTSWFRRLAQLTPESQAALFLDMAYTNTAGLMSLYDNDPVGMVSILKQMTLGGDAVTAGKVAEAMINSPAGKTVAPAMSAFYKSELPEQMLANWVTTTPIRTELLTIADAVGMKAANFLEEVRTNPDAAIQMIANVSQGTPSGKLAPFIEAINNGTLNAETLSKRFEIFWGKNYVPWHPDMFGAELIGKMGVFMDKFLVDHYGIQPKRWQFRLSAALKSFQSLAVLGFNPMYAINNAVNNVFTRAAQGVYGFLTPNQIESVWDRIGIKPAGFEKGVGPAVDIAGTHRGGQAIAAAMDTKDFISQMHKLGRKASKLGLFSKLAARIEIAESRQATTIGFLQLWNKTWKEGVGYNKMSPEIEAQLRTINPRAPELIYSLVNQGLNMDEITNSLYTRSKFQGVESTLERAVQQVFTNQPDKARDIITKSGIIEELKSQLEGAKTKDDITRAFDFIESRIDAIIEQAIADDILAIPDDVANRIRSEGMAAMMPLWSDLWSLFTNRRMKDLVDNQIAAATSDALRSQGNRDLARQVWKARLTEAETDWRRTHTIMLTTAKGMFDALGSDNPGTVDYVNTMTAWIKDWERFYTEKNAELKKYYQSNVRGPQRESLWKATQEKIAGMYDRHTEIETRQLTQMFEQLGKVYEDTSHRPGTEVLAWGQETIKAWNDAANKVKEFRESLRNTELSIPEVRQAFETFNTETFAPLISQQRSAMVDGAYKLWQNNQGQQAATPEQQGVVIPMETPPPATVYPGAEAIRIDLDARSKQYGDDYVASTEERTFLAMMLSELYPDDADRHMVQRYLFDASSAMQAKGSRVRAALDMIVAVGTEEGEYVIPDNIKANLGQVLDAARVSEGQGSLFDGRPADNADPAEVAKYNEADINRRSQEAAEQQQVRADAVMNRNAFRDKIRTAFSLTRDQQSAVMALVDAHAEIWGKREGKSADSYYAETFADIEVSDVSKVITDAYGDTVRVVGEAELLENGMHIIRGFQDANLVDALHEIGHVFRYELDAGEIEVYANWVGFDSVDDYIALDQAWRDGKLKEGTPDYKRYMAAEEQFADGFVMYQHEGMALDVAPPAMRNIFQKFKSWVATIVSKLLDDGKDMQLVDISPEMKRLYDGLLFDEQVMDYRQTQAAKLQHAPTGNTTMALGVKLPDKFNMRFRIVSLTDLITSHFADFTKNKNYPQELQARFRELIGNQTQIWDIINNFDEFKLLLDTRETDTGPMVIGPDMVVESGNGRTIALMIIAKDYPELWNRYVTELTNQLDDNGFNPDALEGIELPVLVRERLDDVDRVIFAEDANQRRTGGMSVLENAFVDAGKWEPELLGEINIARTNDIYTALRIDKNEAIVQSFLDKTPAAEKNQMIDAFRKLSTDGTKRIIASLYAYLFPGEKGKQIVHMFAESTSPATIKNLRNAIDNALPELAKLESKVRSGTTMPEMSLSQDIADVVMAHVTVTNRYGSYAEFQKHWELSPTIFGESYVDIGLIEPNTPDNVRQFKVDLFHFFAENTRKTEPQTQFFKMYVEKVLEQPQYMANQIEIFPVDRTPKHIIASEIFQTLVNEKISYPFEGYEKPAGPTLFQTRAIGDTPLAGTPVPMYEGRITEEAYTETLSPLLKTMREIALSDMDSGQAFSLGDIPEGLNDEVNMWLTSLPEQMAGTKLASMRYGEMMRDRSLLNYQERYNIDDYLNIVFPYQFWFTRSMGEWAKRMVERPSWFSMYARIRRHQERMEEEGIPSRLKGKFRIPAEWLPDFMGNALYIDPLSQIFPFTQFAAPFDRMAQTGDNVQYAAVQKVQQYVAEEKLTATQAKQIIDTKEGEIWQMALAEAQTEMQQSGDLTGMSLASMMMSPAMWWTYPYHMLKGTPEKLYPLPGTRTGQALRSLGGPLGVIGNIMALPEETIRRKFNLSAYGEWGDYYIDRTLANMATEGYPVKDVMVAMIERQGELFEEAYQRVEQEMALKIPGSQTALAIKEGKFGAIPYTLLTTLFPAGLLPEGELIQRGLKYEYGKAWDDYKNGNPAAINEFFDKHPEYQARLALFDEPEERMRQFLVSEIWERWTLLENKNKPLVVDQLGENFERMFLDKNTRDYTAVDQETLAYWARLLGGYVPQTEETSGVSNIPLYQQENLKLYRPDVIAQVEDFQAQRDEQFPNYKFLQTTYFDLPEDPKSVRREFLAEYPELTEYWDWKDNYYDKYPLVKSYQDEQAKRYEDNQEIYTSAQGMDIPTSQSVALQAISENEPAMLMQMLFAYYSGQDVSGGARSMLRAMWESMGYPGGSFEEWSTEVLKQIAR
jgi:hypothetical protein